MRDRFSDPDADPGVTTRADLFDCGVLISAMEGELGPISRSHFVAPVALTRLAKVQLEAYAAGAGVSLATAWQRAAAGFRPGPGPEYLADLLITDPAGVRADRVQRFKLMHGVGDAGERVVTFLLPEEDL